MASGTKFERAALLKHDHMLASYPINESSPPPPSEEERLVSSNCAVNISPGDRITESVSLDDPSDTQALLSTLERTLFLLKTQVEKQNSDTKSKQRPEEK